MVKRVALMMTGVLLLVLVPTTGSVAAAPGVREAFPHSGTQIAIAAAVVVVLLVGGIALWYFSHPRKRKPEDPAAEPPKDER